MKMVETQFFHEKQQQQKSQRSIRNHEVAFFTLNSLLRPVM